MDNQLGTLGESSTSLHQIALAMATQSEAIKAMYVCLRYAADATLKVGAKTQTSLFRERSELAEEEISAPVLQASLPSEDTRNVRSLAHHAQSRDLINT